jgi:hypothetical protein
MACGGCYAIYSFWVAGAHINNVGPASVRSAHEVLTMKYLSWISALVLALAFPPVVYGQSTDSPVERTDPCATLQKSNMIFGISTGGYSTVIHGVPSKRIFVCNVVFFGEAGLQFTINFAGSSSNCTSNFTSLGGLRSNNDVVVSAGGGSSTQFPVPINDSFCIGVGGSGSLFAGGWVTYVVK